MTNEERKLSWERVMKNFYPEDRMTEIMERLEDRFYMQLYAPSGLPSPPPPTRRKRLRWWLRDRWLGAWSRVHSVLPGECECDCGEW